MDTALETAVPEETIDMMVEQYVKMRDGLAAADEAHKLKTEAARKWLQDQNTRLLARLEQLGVDSAATPHGTAYRKTKKTANIADASAFRRFVIGGEHWDIVDWKANAPAVTAFLEENNELPPGLNFNVFTDVGVRRK
jgi:hypothetical protein